METNENSCTSMNRRRTIRMIIFILAGLLTLVIAAVSGRAEAARSERKLAAEYMHSLYGLTESVTDAETELRRLLCSGTDEQRAETAAELLACTRTASVYLAELPSGESGFGSVNRLLDSAADCALELTRGDLTDEQTERLMTLSDYIGRLRVSLEDHIARRDASGWSDELARVSGALTGLELSGCSDGLACAENAVSDCPLFSSDDETDDGTSPSGVLEVTPADAMRAAREFLHEEESDPAGERLTLTGTTEGDIPAFCFSRGDVALSVSRQDGMVVRMTDGRSLWRELISPQEAADRSVRFAADRGYVGCEMTECICSGRRCAVTLTPYDNGVKLCDERIRVETALDDGSVTGFDATEYAKHHRSRAAPVAKITCAQAREALSPRLTERSATLAIITDGGEEKLCYEFLCETWDGGSALVYVNAVTKAEEKVLLIAESLCGTRVF